MSKLTKAQKKRLVKEIISKSKKLYMADFNPAILTVRDLDAIEKLTSKWLKRIG
tara:strand:- start:53 stop:214 length:162 start_codon:yes stop_codon:yes gene_type:complete